jgi:hypothetical protein
MRRDFPPKILIATFKQWFPSGGVSHPGEGGAWDILGKIYGKTELIIILKMSQHL